MVHTNLHMMQVIKRNIIMAFRKNKKFIDPRYFMDEKTEIIKEEK